MFKKLWKFITSKKADFMPTVDRQPPFEAGEIVKIKDKYPIREWSNKSWKVVSCTQRDSEVWSVRITEPDSNGIKVTQFGLARIYGFDGHTLPSTVLVKDQIGALLYKKE